VVAGLHYTLDYGFSCLYSSMVFWPIFCLSSP
jgi:hypothetical protein